MFGVTLYICLSISCRVTGTRSQAAGLRAIIEGSYFAELTQAKESDASVGLLELNIWIMI